VTATSELSKKARNSVISDFVTINFFSLQIGHVPNMELKFQSGADARFQLFQTCGSVSAGKWIERTEIARQADGD
jgi:hypothetical protein